MSATASRSRRRHPASGGASSCELRASCHGGLRRRPPPARQIRERLDKELRDTRGKLDKRTMEQEAMGAEADCLESI